MSCVLMLPYFFRSMTMILKMWYLSNENSSFTCQILIHSSIIHITTVNKGNWNLFSATLIMCYFFFDFPTVVVNFDIPIVIVNNIWIIDHFFFKNLFFSNINHSTYRVKVKNLIFSYLKNYNRRKFLVLKACLNFQ